MNFLKIWRHVLTSSNKNSRKPSGYKLTAGLLAGTAIASVLYLGYQIKGLDESYGRIAEDIGYYTQQVSDLRENQSALRSDLVVLRNEKVASELRLAELEAQKTAAEAAATRALEAANGFDKTILSLKNRLDDAQNVIAQGNQMQREVSNLEGALIELERQQEALGNDISGLEIQKSYAAGEVEQLQDDLQSLTTSVSDLRNQRENLSRDVVGLDARRIEKASLSEQVRRLTVEAADLEKRVDQARQGTQNGEGELERLSVRLSSSEVELGQVREQLGSAQGLLGSATAELDQRQSQLDKLTRQATQASADSVAAKQEQARAETAVEQLRTESGSLKAELSSVTEEVAELTIVRNRLSSEIQVGQARKEEISILKNDLLELTAEREILLPTLKELRQGVATAKAELAQVEPDVQASREALAGLAAREGELLQRVNALEFDAKQAAINQTSAQQEHDQMEEMLGELKSENVAAKLEGSRLDGEISAKSTELQNLVAEIAVTKARMREIAVTESSLAALKTERDGLVPMISERRTELTQVRAELDLALPDLQSSKQLLSQLAARKGELEQRIANLTAEAADALTAKQTAATEEALQAELLGRARTERASLQGQINSLKDQYNDLVERIRAANLSLVQPVDTSADTVPAQSTTTTNEGTE